VVVDAARCEHLYREPGRCPTPDGCATTVHDPSVLLVAEIAQSFRNHLQRSERGGSELAGGVGHHLAAELLSLGKHTARYRHSGSSGGKRFHEVSSTETTARPIHDVSLHL